MVNAIDQMDENRFHKLYREIYKSDIIRQRWYLWRFACEMKAGDIVVVPLYGAFTVCKLKGKVNISPLKDECDIGFEWNIEVLANQCSPRDAYASAGLLSRMKVRHTTLNINDLKVDVDSAVKNFNDGKPFSLPAELAKQCRGILAGAGGDRHFERLVLDYFKRLGAEANIHPKNSPSKEGDCDVSAVFRALKLTISVQAKNHSGLTDDWAVRQIIEYANSLNKNDEQEPNWTYVNWVVSLADGFTDEAEKLAHDNGVILLNGDDFCRMLVSNGIE